MRLSQSQGIAGNDVGPETHCRGVEGFGVVTPGGWPAPGLARARVRGYAEPTR